MFGRIAGRYDLMNALMTGGLDRVWRRRAAAAAALPRGGFALDVGTGTGDLAFDLVRSAPGVQAIGVDYTAPMLGLAPGKARRLGLALQTSWVRGDGQALPFPDATFDAVASAFVLRNFADLGRALAEMARVVRPGGRVVGLEISPTGSRAWQALFSLYFQNVVPIVGAIVTGDPTAYRYLPASVAAFPTPERIGELMATAGLEPLPPQRLMRGSLVIHAGVRAASSGSRPENARA